MKRNKIVLSKKNHDSSIPATESFLNLSNWRKCECRLPLTEKASIKQIGEQNKSRKSKQNARSISIPLLDLFVMKTRYTQDSNRTHFDTLNWSIECFIVNKLSRFWTMLQNYNCFELISNSQFGLCIIQLNVITVSINLFTWSFQLPEALLPTIMSNTLPMKDM